MIATNSTIRVFGELDIPLDGVSVADLVARLDQLSTPEWQRNLKLEERISRSENPVFCYSFRQGAGTDSLPDANLWLATRENHAQISNIVPAKKSQLSQNEYNAILRSFHDSMVVPAARTLGLEPLLSRTEVVLDDLVSPETARYLRTFSACANKSTGSSHPLDRQRWFSFIISHHVQHDNLPPDRLAAWLIADGWADDEASDLAIEFEQGRDLLKQYDSKSW